MNLSDFLTRPFPIVLNNRSKFIAAFSFGAFIFLFLLIFKPFGLVFYTGPRVVLYTLGFGGITFGVMLFNLMVGDRFFPSFFKEESWTIGKEIFVTLIYIAFIGLANYLFAVGISITRPTLNKFLYPEGISLCLAVFPVMVWTLIRENIFLRQSRAEVEKFNPVFRLQTLSRPDTSQLSLNDVSDPGIPLIATLTSKTGFPFIPFIQAVPGSVAG